MTINITGEYKIKQNGKIIYESSNLITFYGLVYFLNRCINDEFTPMKYICLGNSEVVPSKSDTKLGNELIRRNCTCTADIDDGLLKLHSSFNSEEVIGVTEIGVHNGDFLISHDTFNEIETNMLISPIGTVEVEYVFNFSTATIRNGWVKLETYNNISLNGKSIYWIYESNDVLGVYEESTYDGYFKVNTMETMISSPGSYFYDVNKENIYIHIRDESSIASHDILVQTK